MQVDTENRQQGNPFRTRHKPTVSVDAAVLATVQTIPGLGGVKAKCLLERFKSMCSTNNEGFEIVLIQDPWPHSLHYTAGL